MNNHHEGSCSIKAAPRAKLMDVGILKVGPRDTLIKVKAVCKLARRRVDCMADKAAYSYIKFAAEMTLDEDSDAIVASD